MAEERIRFNLPFTPKPPVSRLALAGVLVSAGAAALAVISGLGTRLEIWNFRTGFMVLRVSAFLGAAGVFLSLVGIVNCVLHRRKILRYKGVITALAGVLIGGLVVIIPYTWMKRALQAPAIHDITTDFRHPPEFSQFLPVRPTPAPYGGSTVAKLQKEAYPGIKPVYLNIPYDKAFDSALETARQLKWKIIDTNRPEGRIEAVDDTLWFGFKDDIAIRVAERGSLARVDIRSVSRVGRGDAGTNARRIEKYTAKLKQNASKHLAKSGPAPLAKKGVIW